MTNLYLLRKLKPTTKVAFILLAVNLFFMANGHAQDIAQMAKLIGNNRKNISSNNRASTDYFGQAVAVNGDYAVVGAPSGDYDQNGVGLLEAAGAAYIFKKNGNNWEFFQKISAPAAHRTLSDNFGNAVAIYGDYIVVGAQNEDHDANNANSSTNGGAVYIFKLNAGVWEMQQKLVPSFRVTGSTRRDANFGRSVAISNGYVVVGAAQDDVDVNGTFVVDAGSAYVFKLNVNIWEEQKRLTATTPIQYTYFGQSVAINGDHIFVGAHAENGSRGAVYTYKLTGSDWAPQEKILASDAATSDYFGRSIAVQGDYAVVSAYDKKNTQGVNVGAIYVLKLNVSTNKWEEQKQLWGHATDASFGYNVGISGTHILASAYPEDSNAGAVYMYKFDDNSWTEQRIIAPDRQTTTFMGRLGVAAAIDGNQLFLGADQEGFNETGSDFKERAGAAYFFSLTGNSWNFQNKVVALENVSGTNFGYAVATHGDYAIVGAPQEKQWISLNNGLNNAGKAYIFKRNSSAQWQLEKELSADDATAESAFGFSVAINGNYAIVGANKKEAAYIFYNNGTQWVQQQKIAATDGVATDLFGSAVAISSNYAIVGAHQADLGGQANTGAAYIFKNNGGNWTQQQKLSGDVKGANANFGFAIAMDNDKAVIGAYRETTTPATTAGAIYALALDGSTGQWSSTKLLSNDLATSDWFGYSVAIKGNYIIAGAPQEDHDENGGGTAVNNAGAAYIFKLNEGSWAQQQKLIASDRTASDIFGQSVAITDAYALVGAYNEDHDATGAGTSVSNAGSAYFYKLNNNIWTAYQKVVATDRTASDYLGFALAMDKDAIIGAYQQDSDADGLNLTENAGAAYIFGIPGQTLPVKLIDFTAKADGNTAKLNWQTATETNNQKFVIYRSADDRVFSLLTEINGANHSEITKNYQFIDRKPLSGNNYYRLTQVDYNGDVNELGIQTLSFSLSANTVSIYPNPTADKVTLSFEVGKFTELQLIDVQGRTIKKVAISQLENQAAVDLSSQTNGLYILKLVGPSITEIKKVIKK